MTTITLAPPAPTAAANATKARPLLSISLLALVWGSTFFWTAIAGEGASPAQIVFIRLALASLVLIGFVYSKGLRLPKDFTTWRHLTTAALMANAAPWLLFSIGVQEAGSSMAGTINATTPLWTVAFLLIWRHEKRVGASRAIGLALGIAGVVLVAAPWQNGISSGVIYFVIAAAMFGASFAYTARHLTNTGNPPLVTAAGQLFAATVLSALVLPFTGWPSIQLDTSVIVALLMLGILVTAFGYVLSLHIVAESGAASASTVAFMVPVVAVALGIVFLHETFTVPMAIGGIITLVGAGLVRRRPKQNNEPSQPQT
ncbi:MAG: DMT family transporter [Corynebacteriales bacterium]|nr:DMT family transporter [Mycobacteriales bacterium]